MRHLQIKQSPEAKAKLESYPKTIQPKLKKLRSLILETAIESETIDQLEETLKWGELSYLTKKGSTIRMDWKPASPDQYALYFKCTSKLVPTFKELYADSLTYEKNRAILFALEEELPVQPLKTCIRLALTYHTVKHLPLLGVGMPDQA